ncbi:unnamed protein product [Lampetra planeri]
MELPFFSLPSPARVRVLAYTWRKLEPPSSATRRRGDAPLASAFGTLSGLRRGESPPMRRATAGAASPVRHSPRTLYPLAHPAPSPRSPRAPAMSGVCGEATAHPHAVDLGFIPVAVPERLMEKPPRQRSQTALNERGLLWSGSQWGALFTSASSAFAVLTAAPSRPAWWHARSPRSKVTLEGYKPTATVALPPGWHGEGLRDVPRTWWEVTARWKCPPDGG